MRGIFTLLLLTALVGAAVGGCGNRGPLYLPDDAPAAAART